MNNNLYLNVESKQKNIIKFEFYNTNLKINIFIYLLSLNNKILCAKIFKRFMYENGLKFLLINNTFKIGLKYNFIYNNLSLK